MSPIKEWQKVVSPAAVAEKFELIARISGALYILGLILPSNVSGESPHVNFYTIRMFGYGVPIHELQHLFTPTPGCPTHAQTWITQFLGSIEPISFCAYLAWLVLRKPVSTARFRLFEYYLAIGWVAMMLSELCNTVNGPPLCYWFWSAAIGLLLWARYKAGRAGVVTTAEETPDHEGSPGEVFLGIQFFSVIASVGMNSANKIMWSESSRMVNTSILCSSQQWSSGISGLVYGLSLFVIWLYVLRRQFPARTIERLGWGALAGALYGLIAEFFDFIAYNPFHINSKSFSQMISFLVLMACIWAVQGLWILKAEEKLSSITF